jgi:predicted Zn-dependent protease
MKREVALGQHMAEEVENESDTVDDPVIIEYINRLGQNLARSSDAKLTLRIKIIHSEEIGAYSFPGGFIFVNTALILTAETEAELASVIAHEIGHVAARHGTKLATRSEIIEGATIPLILLGGWAGYAIRAGVSLAAPLGTLQFSRAMEREADHLGIRYLYRSGYDPSAFIDFFEKIRPLEQKKPAIISKFFSKHPPTLSRITRAQREIQEEMTPLCRYLVDTSEFQAIRHRLLIMEN